MVKVSIVLPIYNVAEYLPKSIESVLTQTYQDMEILLVNDGSKDNSLEICRRYEQQDARIQVIDKQNGGLSEARNAGLAKATGEYIYFLDSDDFLEPTCIEKCVTALDSTQSDMVIFDIYQYFLATHTKEVIANVHQGVVRLQEKPEVLTQVLNSAWNKMYKRSLFTENQLEYPVGYYYEDLGTTYRLMMKANQICFVNEPLYNYLADRPGNITTQFNQKTYDIFEMVKINIDAYQQAGLYEQYYEELKFLSCVNILECLKKLRGVKDLKASYAYVDVAFFNIRQLFPEFPKCKYKILRQKNDKIYANPFLLKAYLAYRYLAHR